MNDSSDLSIPDEPETAVGMPVLQDAPLVAIAQPASSKRPEGVPEGQWYAPDSGEGLGKKLVFVPVANFETRSYFPKRETDPNFDAERKQPMCASVDAHYPITGASPPLRAVDGELVTVDNCPACAFGHWRTLKGDVDPKTKRPKRKPPLCALAINFFGVVYQIDDQGDPIGSRVARLRFEKTGYPTAEKLLKSFSAIFPPRPDYTTSVALTITGPHGQDRGQRYYEPSLHVIGPTSKLKWFEKNWTTSGEPAFRGLLKQWPDLHHKLKTRAATAEEDAGGNEVPF